MIIAIELRMNPMDKVPIVGIETTHQPMDEAVEFFEDMEKLLHTKIGHKYGTNLKFIKEVKP